MRAGGLRAFLLALAVVVIPLGVLVVAGATVALRELGREREAATEQMVGVVAALVGEAQDALRREAFILARDPALVESAGKGDWAPLARWGSPRMLALTRDGVADLLIVRDARGVPVVQVPVLPRTSLPDSPATGEPRVSLALVDGRPYFLATAALANPWVADTAADQPLGTVVIGRSVESLRRVLDRAPSRPGLVVIAGERALASTRAGTPEGGWSGAVRAGRAVFDGEVLALRPLAGSVPGPGGALWALVPERELAASPRRLWSWLIALSAGGTLILALAVSVIVRRGGRTKTSAREVPAAAHLDAAREALNAIALTIGRGRDLVETAEEMLDAVSRAVGIAVGIVYRLDASSASLVLLAQRGIDPDMLDRARTRPLEGSYVGEAARTGKTRVTDLTTAIIADREFREQAERRGHRTQLALPIPVEDRIWGVLALVSTERREFAPDELTALEGIAHQVGLAVHRAELADTAAARLRRLEALREIERHISEQLDLDRLLVMVARSALSLIGGTFSIVYLREGDALRPGAWAGIDDWIGEIRIPVGAGVVGHALETGEGLLVNDYATSPLALEPFRNATLRFLAHPLVAAGQRLGVMQISRDEASAPFTAEDLTALADLATQASVAIENARLFAEARRSFQDNRRRVEELSVLHEMSRALTGRLDPVGLLETIYQQLARLLDARHLLILLHDREADCLDVALRVVDGARRDGEPRRYAQSRAGLSGIVLATRRAIRTDDYVGECARRGIDPVSESLGLPHWLGVPMVAGDQWLGVLALRARDRAYTEADERLLASIADLAALALGSARLYEEKTRAHADLAAAQDQLVRTEKLRAMGEMASGMAHDFNNVLAAILGRAQLLLGRVEDPALAQWLHVIERAAMDGARTVRRLQEFTRIRRDQPAEPVDWNRVVEETLEATELSWRDEPRKRGVAIEVETALAEPLPAVSGDPAELREALTNLILNAVDAMPGGGRLRLATHSTDGHVEVTVADTGTGIAAGIRDRIFDPFFTTKGPKGTGLGLSMTYGILARHDGRITVESEEGKGTTFRLVFPASDHVPAAPAGAVAAGPPPAAGGLRCLIVDDEAAVAEVLGDMLGAIGHEATVVASGAEALARLRAGSFDLVLTDLAMPEMTGWEVARAVKAGAPGMPVFLVTGFGIELTPADLAGNGVDLVLAKPLAIADVESALAQVKPRGRDEP